MSFAIISVPPVVAPRSINRLIPSPISSPPKRAAKIGSIFIVGRNSPEISSVRDIIAVATAVFAIKIPPNLINPAASSGILRINTTVPIGSENR